MTQNRSLSFALYLRHSALILLILLPLSAIGSRFGLWEHMIGLLLFSIAMLGCLIIEIICALWLLQKPTAQHKSALRQASIFALPPLVILAALMRGHTGGTMLHDISTDTVTPPQFSNAQQYRGDDSNPLTYSADKAQAQDALYPNIESIRNTLSAEQNFRLSIELCKQLGWEIYFQDKQTGYIEAFQATAWFGFIDDIVIRNSEGKIDLRSVSRIGESDFGANAKRVQDFSALAKEQ